MIELIKFILATGGGTFIITHSSLFKPIREWLTLKSSKIGVFIGCPQCVGFWMGALVYLCILIKLDIFIYSLISAFIGFFIRKYFKL